MRESCNVHECPGKLSKFYMITWIVMDIFARIIYKQTLPPLHLQYMVVGEYLVIGKNVQSPAEVPIATDIGSVTILLLNTAEITVTLMAPLMSKRRLAMYIYAPQVSTYDKIGWYYSNYYNVIMIKT